WSHETNYHRRISTRTTPRRTQSYKGIATIPSQHQCSSTPGAPAADDGKGPKRRRMGTGSSGGGN
ncbi:uncharacterized protein EURHEDRAFT_416312, partial [Aspergillus ruber CBS 135680]